MARRPTTTRTSGGFKLSARRGSPELAIQKQIVAMLRAYLPDAVWWSASLSGVPLSPAVAAQAKAAGLQRGHPDLCFIFLADGRSRYIEVKSDVGTLTPEQALLARNLGPDFRVARSWPDARAILSAWMEPYGLYWLTDAESLRRAATRAA